jgi:hypothetical protein
MLPMLTEKFAMRIGRAILTLCLLTVGLVSAQAQFTYNSGDVLLCFRDTGSAKTYNLVVDCGPVSTFVALPAGQKIYLTNYYNPALVASYIDSNPANWGWAVCAAINNLPIQNDLWITRPRSTPSQQTSAWLTGNTYYNGPTVNTIDASGAGLAADAQGMGDSPSQGTTWVVEQVSTHSVSFSGCYQYYLLGRSGVANLGGFQGVVEQLTSMTAPVRADFYQLLGRPSTVNGTAGTYLGYFEISTNGAVVYTSGPSPSSVTAPQIVRIVNSGITNTIYFTTVSGGTYNLLGTNTLTAARTNWPVIGSSLTGDGLTNLLQDISSTSPKYYTIRAQ